MMTNSIRLTILAVLFALSTHTSDAGTWSQIDFTGGNVSTIASFPVDRNIMLACVDGKGVWRSTDRGMNWSAVLEGYILDIDISRDDMAYAVGESGVFVSDDSGETWRNCLNCIASVVFAYRDGIVSVDTYSSGVHSWRLSYDNGDNWEDWNGIDSTVSFLFLQDGTVFRNSENVIYRAEPDDWNRWEDVWRQNSYFEPDLRFGYAVGDSVVYAYSRYIDYHPVGYQAGGLFRSDDSCTSWEKCTDIYSVSAFGHCGDTVVIGTPDGDLYVVIPEVEQPEVIGNFGGEITSIDALGYDEGEIIVSTKSGIFRTNDGGQNWQKSDAGHPHSEIVSVQVIPAGRDGERIIIASKEGGIYYSDNGGDTWIWASSEVRVTPGLLRKSANAPRRIYAAESSIHVSRDNGETWKLIEPFPASYYGWYARTVDIDIDPRDSDRIVVNYYNHSLDHYTGTILVSGRFDATMENEWDRWRWEVDTDKHGSFRSQFSADGSLLWVSYNWYRPPVDPLIQALDESGELVHEIALPGSENGHYYLVDDSNIYIFNENKHRFWRSPDLGVSWDYCDLELDEYVRFDDRNIAGHLGEIIKSPDGETLYLLYPGNGVLTSVDNGRTWGRLDEGLESAVVWQIDFSVTDMSCFYAATDNGLFKYDSKTVEVKSHDNMPCSLSLGRNFPNPFNPVTTIPFSISSSSHVRLTVYSALGQRVATLIDNPLPAGQHSVQFNAEGLSSGLYFIHIEVGTFSETGSMLLVK